MNTVMGMPEPRFREGWIAMLWHAMARTGEGYRRQSMRRIPPAGASHWRGERRADKLASGGRTKLERRLQKKAVQA